MADDARLAHKLEDLKSRISSRINQIDENKAGKANGEARLVNVVTQGIANRYFIEDAHRGLEYAQRKRSVYVCHQFASETAPGTLTTLIDPPLENVVAFKVLKGFARAAPPNHRETLFVYARELTGHFATNEFARVERDPDTGLKVAVSGPLFSAVSTQDGRATLTPQDTVALDRVVPVLGTLSLRFAPLGPTPARIVEAFVHLEVTTLEPESKTETVLHD